MEIVELSLQAFGPYKKRQTILFDKLREHPIFLITGPTGAGKTSIFDAICFALYGKASGSDRDQETLRSQLSTPEEKTFVAFTFRINNRTYSLHRYPKQTILKERGEGTKEEPAKAELYFDPFNENTLLASKVREVDQLIEEMLGLNYEQFRKMMMIPQGEFRKLISENSREREEVLRKIFDTSLYLDVTERLKQKKTSLQGAIEKSRTRAKEVLGRVYLEESTELPESPAEALPFISEDISKKKESTASASRQRELKNEEKLRLERKIQDIERHNKLLNEWEEYQRKQENLEAQKNEIKGRQKEAAKAEEAAGLEVYESQVKEAERHVESLHIHIKETEQKYRNKQKEKDYKLKEKDKLSEKEEERLQLGRKMERLGEVRTRLPEVKEKEEMLQKSKKEMEELNVSIQHREELLDQYKKDASLFKEKLDELRNIEQTYFDKKAEWNEKKAEADSLYRLRNLAEEREKITEKLRKEKEKLTRKEEELRAKEAEQNRLIRAKTDYQAYLLSHSLESGGSCPVCGSVHHPSPASRKHAVEENEISSMEVAVNALKKEREELLSYVYQSEADEKAKNDTIRSLLSTVTSEVDSEEAATFKKLSLDMDRVIDQLEKECSRLASLKKEKEEVGKKQEKTQGQLEKLSELIALEKEKRDNHRQRVTGIKAELGEFYRNFSEMGPAEDLSAEVIEEKYESIREKFTKMTEEKETLEEEISSLSEELYTLRGTWNQLLDNLEKAKVQVKEKEEEFKQTFDQTSFVDKEDYEASKRTRREIDEINQKVQKYFQDQAVINSRLHELEEEIGDQKSLISTEKLFMEKAELEEDMEKLQEKIAKKQQELNQNEKVLQELGQVLKEQEESEQLFYDIGDLARLTSGDNPLRLSLERYVLASYLDEILLQANQRLQIMTDHRYQLKRSEEIAKRGAQSGLDLEVMDQYTGMERSVRTLSGGEGFKAALSLALGMADVVQSYAGGIQLNTLFIDEGFGTLDDISLQQAIECLKSLQDGNRLLGIISHVPQLKEEIPVQMQVTSAGSGSKVTINYK